MNTIITCNMLGNGKVKVLKVWKWHEKIWHKSKYGMGISAKFWKERKKVEIVRKDTIF